MWTWRVNIVTIIATGNILTETFIYYSWFPKSCSIRRSLVIVIFFIPDLYFCLKIHASFPTCAGPPRLKHKSPFHSSSWIISYSTLVLQTLIIHLWNYLLSNHWVTNIGLGKVMEIKREYDANSILKDSHSSVRPMDSSYEQYVIEGYTRLFKSATYLENRNMRVYGCVEFRKTLANTNQGQNPIQVYC